MDTKQVPDICDVLPHCTTVAQTSHDLANDICRVMMSEVVTLMENNLCTTTLDIWTDNCRKNHFLSLTAHYICDWVLKNRLLYVSLFPNEPKSGENIMWETVERSDSLGIQLCHLQKLTFVGSSNSQ